MGFPKTFDDMDLDKISRLAYDKKIKQEEILILIGYIRQLKKSNDYLKLKLNGIRAEMEERQGLRNNDKIKRRLDG
jgi:hypothetical protein